MAEFSSINPHSSDNPRIPLLPYRIEQGPDCLEKFLAVLRTYVDSGRVHNHVSDSSANLSAALDLIADNRKC